MTRQELVKTRIDLAKQMNEFIINLGDEDIWDTWITEGIPDEPSMDDYELLQTVISIGMNCVNSLESWSQMKLSDLRVTRGRPTEMAPTEVDASI